MARASHVARETHARAARAGHLLMRHTFQIEPSYAVQEKALLILEQRRAIPVMVDPPGMLVRGFGGDYVVWANRQGISCSCMAGCDTLLPKCYHAVAAMLVWAELSEQRPANPEPAPQSPPPPRPAPSDVPKVYEERGIGGGRRTPHAPPPLPP